jgi:hypothetical protein
VLVAVAEIVTHQQIIRFPSIHLVAAFTMLMALGHFLFCNSTGTRTNFSPPVVKMNLTIHLVGVELAGAMDLNIKKYATSSVEKIRQAAADVTRLLSVK